MNGLLGFVAGSAMVLASFCLFAVIIGICLRYEWAYKEVRLPLWLVKRRDKRTLTFFGFLNICLGCFPWQESESHSFWRVQHDKMTDAAVKSLDAKYEPRYSLGWAACGDSFYRAVGFKLTHRDIRIDVWIGIIWISWLPFKPTKPRA